MKTLKTNITKRHRAAHLFSSLTLAVLLIIPFQSFSQEEKKTVPDGTEGAVHVLHGVDSVTGKAEKLPANEFDNSYSTFKIGAGYIHDYVTYVQSDVFKQQMDSGDFVLDPQWKLRDFRILFTGRLKTKRTLTWKFAFMYDGEYEKWLVRETGVIIGAPELAGHIFIGRTKNGFSLVKVMNGHFPWGAERQMALDPIPILSDGIKWFGHLPKSRIFWNLGYYNDRFSEGQAFSTNAWQYVARVGWMPYYNKEKNRLVHIAANLSYASPLNGQITVKSRPESNPTPQLISTGKFNADNSSHVGGEIYFSTGRLMLGSEVMMHSYYSPGEDHQFIGGNAVLTYSITGAVRPYTTNGSIYAYVPVKKPVYEGGWGEWEAVLHISTFNLNDGSLKGGQFRRFTPMINWYLSNNLRFEFIYGYGEYDRYGLLGDVQFFQFRVQVSLL